ncbi:DUF3168 domain-containing protein [Asticcacaulis sp. ZE23SCel15]|uniref:DUF3168 domain-containing protein n=1 Tax=Asticcacaulis sp. ZE23SCel15 TaxID=3059027 RepID=UPI00265E7D9A|nr:DUF3168 domain-containing protein [Asticcacaulis sp. ZE23SCel15]WKL57718.1 DUF3168 domain-containing protein [Asticcacaulis sp. ZE23SCel15]
MNPLNALQQALITHLRTQDSLKLWLGNAVRVYDQLPEEIIYPYVTLDRVEARPLAGNGDEITEQIVTLSCVSRFYGTEEAKAVAAELRVILDSAQLTLEGNRLANLRVSYVDVFRGTDQRTIYGVVRVRAVTEIN